MKIVLDTPTDPFASLEAMREAHGDLLERYHAAEEEKPPEELLDAFPGVRD